MRPTSAAPRHLSAESYAQSRGSEVVARSLINLGGRCQCDGEHIERRRCVGRPESAVPGGGTPSFGGSHEGHDVRPERHDGRRGSRRLVFTRLHFLFFALWQGRPIFWFG